MTLVIVVSLSSVDFETLVTVLNGVYCLSMLLEFAALLRLRQLGGPRPYRVPLNLTGCCVLLVAPTCMCLLLLVLPYVRGDWTSAAAVLGAALLGPLLHVCLGGMRARWPDLFISQGQAATHIYD